MSFVADLEKYAKKTGKSVEKVFRGTVLQMSNAIILKTPIDEGRARGNWQASIGKPKNRVINRKEAGAIGEVANVAQTVKIGQVFFLSNNLPYIKPLEEGSSTQAPNGMLAVTVANFEKTVARLARATN
jgi:hypothetical protein